MRKSERGATLTLALVIATLFVLAFASIYRHLFFSSHQGTYFNSMNETYLLAETGLQHAAGVLGLNPNAYLAPGFSQPVVSNDGKSSFSSVAVQSQVIPNAFYIVTNASRIVNNKTYTDRLHAHVRISNVYDYFAAVRDKLVINDGIDASTGKIYAHDIEFINENSYVPTKVYSANFWRSCVPPLPWNAMDKNNFVMMDPANTSPVQLQVPAVFPEILDADMVRYRTLAGPHTTATNFSGKIYPPGYNGYTANDLGDSYASHTADNTHHIYYSASDMHIEGTVYGQVLFVSEENIYITGNLVSADVAEALPGAGAISSSTAHQAILITKKNVIIDSTFYKPTDSGVKTQNIQALILAPYGALFPISYNNETTHSNLRLDFKGSMILNTLNSLGSVFRNSRTYAYMDSLKINPPPYLPAIIEILYSYEEVTADQGMY